MGPLLRMSKVNLEWLVSIGSGGYFIRVVVGTDHCGHIPVVGKK